MDCSSSCLLTPCPPAGRGWWVCHAFAARPVGGSQPVAQGRESMPPSHTSLSLAQIAIYDGKDLLLGKHSPVEGTPMGYLLFALVWVLNLAISFWNAYACGKAWAEARFH